MSNMQALNVTIKRYGQGKSFYGQTNRQKDAQTNGQTKNYMWGMKKCNFNIKLETKIKIRFCNAYLCNCKLSIQSSKAIKVVIPTKLFTCHRSN